MHLWHHPTSTNISCKHPLNCRLYSWFPCLLNVRVSILNRRSVLLLIFPNSHSLCIYLTSSSLGQGRWVVLVVIVMMLMMEWDALRRRVKTITVVSATILNMLLKGILSCLTIIVVIAKCGKCTHNWSCCGNILLLMMRLLLLIHLLLIIVDYAWKVVRMILAHCTVGSTTTTFK